MIYIYFVGSSSGGQTATITGSGFDDTTTATICGNPCVKDDSASQTASQFICVTPAASGMCNYCNLIIVYAWIIM